ncbi:unnamed protein product, partial [Ectocarpus fasciculatus]
NACVVCRHPGPALHTTGYRGAPSRPSRPLLERANIPICCYWADNSATPASLLWLRRERRGGAALSCENTTTKPLERAAAAAAAALAGHGYLRFKAGLVSGGA